MTAEAGSDVEALLGLFPLGFCVGDCGRIRAAGATLSRRFSVGVGDRAAGRLTPEQTPTPQAGDALAHALRDAACRRRAVKLHVARRPGDATVSLQGGVLETADGLLFLGVLAPSHASGLDALGLSIGDFGPIDTLPSFAIMAGVQQAMLEDAQALNGRLEKAIAEQKTLRNALAAQNVALEETVAERTRTISQQADDLREALAAQTELNALQRSFTSMISHEFRTPLAIIDGAAGGMERRARRDRVDSRYVLSKTGTLRRAVARMTALMETTLEAARLEATGLAPTSEDIDPVAIVREVCSDHASTSTTHAVRLNVDHAPAVMRADPQALTHITSNLVSNAIKYSPAADSIDVVLTQEDDAMVLRVRDHGVGMPMAETPRLFERYFRASTSVGIAGTGIGLSLVKMLVDSHEGAVSVTTGPGAGACFTVRLPLAGPTSRKDAPQVPAQIDPATAASAPAPRDDERTALR